MEIIDPVTRGIPESQDEGIAAGSTAQHVGAGITDQDVVTGTTIQEIVARPALEQVVAAAGGQHVGTVAARYPVISPPPETGSSNTSRGLSTM